MIDIHTFSGRMGNEMFRHAYLYAQLREGNIPDFYLQDPKYFEKYKKRRAQKGIRTRLIMETSEVAEARKEGGAKDLSEVKLIPPAFLPLHFSAGCYIFPDRVIFISYRKEHSATEIFSKEMSEFMQTIFNFMWKMIA